MNDTTTPIQNSSSEYLKFADLIFNINSPEPDLPRALITAHLSPDILRASGTNHATHCAIGKDFLKTYSRDSTQALRTLVTKFHLRLNDDLLKSKSTRAGYSLRHLHDTSIQFPFATRVMPFIHSGYFEFPENKKIFEFTKHHFNVYNTPPTTEALLIALDNDRTCNEALYKQTVIAIRAFTAPPAEQHPDFLLTTTENWLKDRAYSAALMTGITSPSSARGSIPDAITAALTLSLSDTSIGTDYKSSFDARYDYQHQTISRVPFDLPLLNEITSGGLQPKTLSVLMAGTGTGKSLALCHIAASAFTRGYDTLYITCEMSENSIAERIDANLLDTPLNELRTLSKNQYLRLVSNSPIPQLKSRLVVKEFPTASASTQHIKALLNDLKQKQNFTPQLVVVDYLNLMTSARISTNSNSNSYTVIKAISEELRGLAVEFNLPIITATQTTRSGSTKAPEDLDLSDTAESFGLPATADLMLALITTEELDAVNQIMVKQLKNRHTDITHNRKFTLRIDRSRMKLAPVLNDTNSNSNSNSITPFNRIKSRLDASSASHTSAATLSQFIDN